MKYNTCPDCEKKNLQCVDEETEGDDILRSMICLDCLTNWTAIYRWFDNVDIVEDLR